MIWNNNTIEDEIKRNSLEYGVAVNTDRSIPDAKSGLKPVARRTLWTAYETKRNSNKPHVKSARIVGDIMGKYHPHGDSSIYGALIRLSQPWIMRYPLIDIHGNKGTILGDGPAAMRYTEARLTKIAEEGLLDGLSKKSVDFVPNYDETEKEPITLPAIFPNLLCNPNEGIGWAMGCSWAPHNLVEVADAINQYLAGEEPTLPGPDFPTGGIVINKDDIPKIMQTGSGTVKIRGKYELDGNNIIFTEIPYGTRVENLMEQIGRASDEEKISKIKDIRNETGKKGIRLVIEIERNGNLALTIRKLFEHTDLQSTFSYNQIALIGKTPTELNLKGAIEVYVNHNLECVQREYKNYLDKALARLEIVNGLLRALEDIDNIIILIKQSSSSAEAKNSLIEKYNFSDVQAQAILDMKLSRLAHLEKVELINEKADLEEKIKEFSAFLDSEELQIKEIQKRLKMLVIKYGDERRTKLEQITETKEDKEVAHVEPEKVVVITTAAGNIKRIPASSFKEQKRNTKGKKIQQDDITISTIKTNTIDNLMVFTNKGKVYKILVDDIPQGTNVSMGVAISSLIEFDEGEKLAVVYSLDRGTDAKYVLFVTKNGLIKKVALSDFNGLRRRSGVQAIKFKEDDELAGVSLIDTEDIMLISKMGQAIKFKSDFGASGRTAMGVIGMRLNKDDMVISVLPIKENSDNLAIFFDKGQGKQIKLSEFVTQGKGGKGVRIGKTGLIVNDAIFVGADDILLCTGSTNSVCISAKELPIMGRAAAGNIIIKGDAVLSASKI